MSRKISDDAATAFLNRKKFKRDNTEVIHDDVETTMWLYGNCIASLSTQLVICGQANKTDGVSRTTKCRLNSLLDAFSGKASVHHKDKKFILSTKEDREIDGNEWINISEILDMEEADA